MPEILLVTSFKGGVGKSTVSANIASRLAKSGKKTLLCDLDFDLGTLDLITGCEDRLLFYDRRGILLEQVNFGGNLPTKCLLTDTYQTLVFNENAVGSRSIVTVYDGTGAALYRCGLDGRIVDMESDAGAVYILFENAAARRPGVCTMSRMIVGRYASHLTSRRIGASPAGIVTQSGFRKSVHCNPVRMS